MEYANVKRAPADAEFFHLQRQLDDLKERFRSVPSTTGRVTEQTVKRIVAARRKREKIFGANLFADPAWDILLDLYAAHLGQRRISITDLCSGARVPTTTALRWLDRLSSDELVERRPDPCDKRRIWIELSAAGVAAMASYFEDWPLPME